MDTSCVRLAYHGGMPAILSTQLKIGMEIHVELATRTKMFTRAPSPAHPAHYDAAPNALIT